MKRTTLAKIYCRTNWIVPILIEVGIYFLLGPPAINAKLNRIDAKLSRIEVIIDQLNIESDLKEIIRLLERSNKIQRCVRMNN